MTSTNRISGPSELRASVASRPGFSELFTAVRRYVRHHPRAYVLNKVPAISRVAENISRAWRKRKRVDNPFDRQRRSFLPRAFVAHDTSFDSRSSNFCGNEASFARETSTLKREGSLFFRSFFSSAISYTSDCSAACNPLIPSLFFSQSRHWKLNCYEFAVSMSGLLSRELEKLQ